MASRAPHEELDPVARFVDENPVIRRALAFPVGFVSASNWLASCIHVAAELRVFDALAYGPRTVTELADELIVDPEALARLLRALGGQGPIVGVVVEVFDSPLPFELPFPLPIPQLPNLFGTSASVREPPPGKRRFALTPLGALLREDAVGSMRPWAMFSGKELGRAWSDGLLHAVRTGRPDFGASQRDGGASEFFEYMRSNPDAAARFDESMQAVSTYALERGSAVSLFDWSCGGRARSVVDVGGGTGTLLGAILARYEGLSGILFDQQHVLGRSAHVLDAAGAGVRERTTLVPGSFFEVGSMPVGKDVYVLKNIIHDWPNADATTILANVAAVMKPDSTIVVLEIVRRERTGHDPFTIDFNDFFDLNMLVTVGGKERSRAELEVLFAAAGLDLVHITMGPDGGVSAIQGKLPAHKREQGARQRN